MNKPPATLRTRITEIQPSTHNALRYTRFLGPITRCAMNCSTNSRNKNEAWGLMWRAQFFAADRVEISHGDRDGDEYSNALPSLVAASDSYIARFHRTPTKAKRSFVPFVSDMNRWGQYHEKGFQDSRRQEREKARFDFGGRKAR